MSKTPKIIGIAVLSIVAIICTIVAIVFSITSGMTETADGFFSSVKKQDFTKARTYLAEEFRANTDEQALKAYLSKSAVLNFKEASWSSRSINGGRGELDGSISTDSGGNIPIKLTFVKEGETWKIYTLQKPSAGLQSDTSGASIPSKDEQIALVKKSWHDFAVSVNAKSMAHFHSTVSGAWKSQFTVQKFDETFGRVFDAGLDLTVLDPLAPVFDGEPTIDENGILLIKGHYATTPKQIHFEQKFVYEGLSWKLFGFKFNTQ